MFQRDTLGKRIHRFYQILEVMIPKWLRVSDLEERKASNIKHIQTWT
jgi:hypothetical protein